MRPTKKGKFRKSMRRWHNHDWDAGHNKPLKVSTLTEWHPWMGALKSWLIQPSVLRWWNYPPYKGPFKRYM